MTGRHRPRGAAPGPVRPPGSRIHEGLVGARALIGTAYLADPGLRSEYARDIAPRTGAALGKILRQLYPEKGHRQQGGEGREGEVGETHSGRRRMLDLGAGTGAAGEAARSHFDGKLELVSVDQVPLLPSVLAMDVTDVPALSRAASRGGPFDLVVAAHVLNELFLDQEPAQRSARLSELVGRWCQRLLSDGGNLVLIEPALRETSRMLLAVRDQLLASGLHIVAPCFLTAPCPALLRERDWCHDAAPPLAATPLHGLQALPPATAARVAPRHEHRVDFSYLVVRASGEPTKDLSLFRVVSDPLPEKGRLKLFACGLSGRQPLVRLNRHLSPTNSPLDTLARGDVAQITKTTFAQDGLRLGPETTVRKTNPT